MTAAAPDFPRRMRRVATWLLLALGVLPRAWAGVVTQGDLERWFPDALRILPKDHALPVWPIVKLDGPRETVVAYVFESIDFAPLPGFGGEPFNLLIALDRQGQLVEVRVLSQREPVFLDGLGTEPLFRFVEQYRGKSIVEPLRVAVPRQAAGGAREPGTLDGVSKATASVRIVNETVVAAALTVARAKLGYATRRSAASVRAERFERLSWREMLDRGLVASRELTEAEVDAAFAGTDLLDADGLAGSRAATRWWAAYLNVPSVGRSLLGELKWRALQERLQSGDHALLVWASGPRQFIDEEFQRGGAPRRLVLRQEGLPIALRDLDFDLPQPIPGAPPAEAGKVLRIAGSAGFDPATAWQLALRVERRQSPMLGDMVHRDFPLRVTLPHDYFVFGENPDQPWLSVWRARAEELVLLGVSLAVLVAALLAASRRALDLRLWRWFRWGFLAVTFGFIGYIAQGQVSIVQIAGLVKALVADSGLGFLGYDPMTFALLLAAVFGLLIWGRGAFCGWLCPFGAMQEFVAVLARRLKLSQWRVQEHLDRRLAGLKYLLLLAILGCAAWVPAWSDTLALGEPFKTAFTLAWRTSAWALAYALGLLALAAFIYKVYCRWLCPLGALLAAGELLRRWDWIPRRGTCGQPCQICRKHCAYGAIGGDGGVDYRRCFACMECVLVYRDPRRCPPLRAASSRGITTKPGERGER